MNSYVALARKWRPAQFSDIVGQSAVVKTLMNAIKLDRVHPAYLFTGSRGVGKTSIARIFAKALRCENLKVTDNDLKSCGECSNCKEITTSSSMDVIEIDGASNNGVDAVRDIRDNARFMPSSGKRKIYIIDEVHMLTTAAFNALLKTLEEPPAHIVFIFATTEPHKIPSTVHSRCQRFNFQRGSSAQLQALLAQILKAEGFDFEAGALSLIAKAAEGSMRDSLSLLDQIIAFSGKKITVTSARESLGLIESQLVLSILEGVLSKQTGKALEAAQQAFQAGHDLKILVKDLIEYLHAVIIAKVQPSHGSHLEVSEEDWQSILSFSKLRELEEMEMIFQVFHYGYETLVRSPHPKVALDLILIKCSTADVLISLGDLQEKKAPAAVAQVPAMNSTAAVIKTAPAQVAPQAAAPVASSGPKNWEGFVSFVRGNRPLIGSFLEHALMGANNDAELEIAFTPESAYKKDQLQSKLYLDTLTQLSQTYFGKPLKIKLTIRTDAQSGGESLAQKKEREIKDKIKIAETAAHNDPIIKEAKALFGGELGPIEMLETTK